MISMQPYLDRQNQIYKNIIVLNKKPDDKLAKITRDLYPPKLSNFLTSNLDNHLSRCIVAFNSIKNPCKLMTVNELPELFTYLIDIGYIIDTSVTKMISGSNIKFDNKKLICFVSKKKN